MRKSKPKKRIILPDPKFNDVLVTRFVNDLMVDGKKSVAYSVFYDAMEMIGSKNEKHRALATRSMEESIGKHYPSSGS
jgi:small subunit ribosomal protein S7